MSYKHMTEEEIVAAVASLDDENWAFHNDAEAKLLTQLLIDIHRIAEASARLDDRSAPRPL